MWVWQFTFHLLAVSVFQHRGGFFFVLAVTPFSKVEVGMTLWTDSVIWHFAHPSSFHLLNFGLVCVLPHVWGVLLAPTYGGTHMHIISHIYNTVFATLFHRAANTTNFCFCDPLFHLWKTLETTPFSLLNEGCSSTLRRIVSRLTPRYSARVDTVTGPSAAQISYAASSRHLRSFNFCSLDFRAFIARW